MLAYLEEGEHGNVCFTGTRWSANEHVLRSLVGGMVYLFMRASASTQESSAHRFCKLKYSHTFHRHILVSNWINQTAVEYFLRSPKFALWRGEKKTGAIPSQPAENIFLKLLGILTKKIVQLSALKILALHSRQWRKEGKISQEGWDPWSYRPDLIDEAEISDLARQIWWPSFHVSWLIRRSRTEDAIVTKN